MQRRNQFTITHLQKHFGDTGNTGGTFQVSYVGFHRSDRTAPGRQRGVGKRLAQTVNLNWIAQRCTCSMRLNVRNRGNRHAGSPDCLTYQFCLPARIWNSEATGPSTVIHRRTLDNGVDVIPIGDGAGKRLENEHADALARHIATPTAPKGAASTVVGEELIIGQLQVLLGVYSHVDPTGERHRRITVPDAGDRQVDGDERGRAGRIHGNTGASQAEAVRDPIRHRGVQRRGSDTILTGDKLVVVPHDARKHTHTLARQSFGWVARIFERMPGGLEEQALLRVHSLGIPPRDREERGREPIDAVDESSPAAVGLAAPASRRIEEQLVVPPIERHFGDRVAASDEILPKRRNVGSLRVATCKSNNSDVGRLGGI
nr:hypothetical protein [uncultured bacterium]